MQNRLDSRDCPASGSRPPTRRKKRRGALLSAYVLLVAGLAATPAFAQGQPQSLPQGAALPQAAPPDAASLAEAKELYRQAKERYLAKDLEGALSLMEKSYALSKKPELLFNLGQLNRELGRCQPALDYYQRYLENAATGTHRTEAMEASSRLADACPPGFVSEVPSEVPAQSEASHSYWTTHRIVAWSVLAASALTASGALYFALRSGQDAHDVEAILASTAMQPPAARKTWEDTGQALQTEGEHAQNWAIGLGVASAGLLCTGLIMLAFDPGKGENRAPTLAVTI